MTRMNQSHDYTIDELISARIAHQIEDGNLVGQGLATPLVAAGYLLARLTHAPHMRFASAIGQAMCEDWAPLGLARAEELWLGKAVVRMGFARVVTEVLPTHPFREFFRPGQIDAQGNFNNFQFGVSRDAPRLRLPGAGGIPDVTTYVDDIYIYVPRHSRITFVETVDFISGLGHVTNRDRGAGPRYCITNLGEFDWAEGHMRLTSYHSGVSIDTIQKKTGFQLTIAEDVHETPAPTEEKVHLLREIIDPLGIRKLELLSGSARKSLLRDILAREGAL